MKKLYIQLYAFFVVLILLMTLSWFAFRISVDADNGSAEARRYFTQFAGTFTGANSDNLPQVSILRNRLDQLNIKAFILISGQNNILLSYPENSDLIIENNGKMALKAPSRFIKLYSTEVNLDTKTTAQKAVLSAAINTLSPELIFIRSRTVFFISFTLFLFTVAVLLMQYLQPTEEYAIPVRPLKSDNFHQEDSNSINRQEPAETEKKYRSEEKFIKQDKQYTLSDLDDLNIYKNNTIENTTEDIKMAEAAVSKSCETSKEGTFPPFSAANEFSVEQDEVQKIEYSSKDFFCAGKTKITEGLYSPSTGTGWESYLHERLESELQRAASSEQDISLLIIKAVGTGYNEITAQKAGQTLTEVFKFRDLVFEYGENGFAGILQDACLDDAIHIGEIVHQQLTSNLKEIGFEGTIFIGITTRAMRLLSAYRMIEEASVAVTRAEEMPNDPIIAFRPNPDKYRKFVKENI